MRRAALIVESSRRADGGDTVDAEDDTEWDESACVGVILPCPRDDLGSIRFEVSETDSGLAPLFGRDEVFMCGRAGVRDSGYRSNMEDVTRERSSERVETISNSSDYAPSPKRMQKFSVAVVEREMLAPTSSLKGQIPGVPLGGSVSSGGRGQGPRLDIVGQGSITKDPVDCGASDAHKSGDNLFSGFREFCGGRPFGLGATTSTRVVHAGGASCSSIAAMTSPSVVATPPPVTAMPSIPAMPSLDSVSAPGLTSILGGIDGGGASLPVLSSAIQKAILGVVYRRYPQTFTSIMVTVAHAYRSFLLSRLASVVWTLFTTTLGDFDTDILETLAEEVKTFREFTGSDVCWLETRVTLIRATIVLRCAEAKERLASDRATELIREKTELEHRMVMVEDELQACRTHEADARQMRDHCHTLGYCDESALRLPAETLGIYDLFSADEIASVSSL